MLKQPYLATAMRLSLPVPDIDSNREELLKEIAALESDIAGFSKELLNDVSVTSPNIEKRYLEWPGKRSLQPLEVPFNLGFRPMSMRNKHSEKAMAYPPGKSTFKRWAEFVGGKRYIPGDAPLVNRKRWYEFVGKRYDPALFMHFPKRYSEFVGKK